MKLIVSLVLAVLILAVSVGAAGIEFVGSALWNNIRDVEARDSLLFSAYVQGLQIFDISRPDTPEPLGRLFLKGWCHEVAVSGNLAFLAGCYEGLPIIDVSDPRNPRLVNIYSDIDVVSVNALGDLIFAGDTSGVMHIIDASDPLRLKTLYRYGAGGHVLDVAFGENLAFLSIGIKGVYGYDGGYLQALDLSDPSQPAPLGVYHTEGSAGQAIVRDGYAYLVDSRYGLTILDVDDPQNIVLVGRLRHLIEESNTDLEIVGNILFLAKRDGGFHMVDISYPAKPRLLTEERSPLDPEFREPRSMNISVEGGHAYLTGTMPQLRVFDVRDPSNPRRVGAYSGIDAVNDIIIAGDYAYVLDKNNGLVVAGISPKGEVAPVSFCPLSSGGEGIAVSGDIAIVALGDSGIIIVDVSDPGSPAPLGRYAEKRNASIRRAFIRNNLAYLTGFFSGAIILDISDPQNPTKVARFIGTEYIADIHFNGSLAYCASENAGLQVFDLSDPLKPELMGSYDTQYANAVEVSGSYAFIADGAEGLVIADVSEPTNIVAIASFKAPGKEGKTHDLQFTDIELSGDVAFLLDREYDKYKRGVLAVDISDPANPVLLADYGPVEFSERLVVRGDLIFIPDWSNLTILRYLK